MSQGGIEAPGAIGWPKAWAPVGRIAAGVGSAIAGAFAFRGLLDLGSGPPGTLQGAERALFEPTASSPHLVIGATAWLLAARWSRLRAALRSGESAPLAALLLLAPAVALLVWGHYVSAPALLLPSLSLLLLGGALWLGGRPAFRAMRMPALFLLFLLPLPVALVNRFMYPLQIATANVATAMLRAVGLDVTSHGDLMFYDGHVFQVIEACSGLRIAATIFMSSFLYVEIFWRNRLQSTLLVLASPLIGLLANLVRVATVVLNPLSHIAAVHTAQGLVVIVIAVFALAVLDSLLTRLLGPRWDPPRERVVERGPAPLGPILALLALVVSLAGVTFAVPPWQADPQEPAAKLSALPGQLEGWKAQRLPLETEFLGSVSFPEWIQRRYESPAGRVDVLLGANPRLDPAQDFLSAKIDLPGPGWVVEERRSVRVPGVDADVTRLQLRDPRGARALVYRWFEGVGSPRDELLRSLLSLDRSPLRRPGRALVIRLTTPMGSEAGSEARAQSRLDGFAPHVARFLAPEAPAGSVLEGAHRLADEQEEVASRP